MYVLIKQKTDGLFFFQDKKERIGVINFPDEASACDKMKEELRKMMEQLYGVTWAPAR